MKTIALIPARGGSKNVTKKNIRLLNGIPLIAHSIRIALSNERIDKTYVTTDSAEIAEIAVKYGAEVPFLRPVELAQDTTPDRPVIIHSLDWLNKYQGMNPDLVVFLRPTSPLRTQSILNGCIDTIINNSQFTSLRTVNHASGVNHPYWMFKRQGNILEPFIDNIDLSKYYQRQLLPECLKLNGVVDILRPDVVTTQTNVFGNKIGFFEIDEINAIDIDSELELAFAQYLIKENKIPF